MEDGCHINFETLRRIAAFLARQTEALRERVGQKITLCRNTESFPGLSHPAAPTAVTRPKSEHKTLIPTSAPHLAP